MSGQYLKKILNGERDLALLVWKVGDREILKTIEPIRNKMSFTMRLEQGEKYRCVLKGLDGQMLDKVVIADGRDIKIDFYTLCRKESAY
jgi:hypothetical protein